MSLFKATLISLAVELVSIVSFIRLSTSDIWQVFRYPILVAAAFFIAFIFYRSAKNWKLSKVIYLFVILLVGSIVLVEGLAFTIYPGLAKDIDLVSVENATTLGKLVLLSALIHGGLLVLALGGLKISNRKLNSAL